MHRPDINPFTHEHYRAAHVVNIRRRETINLNIFNLTRIVSGLFDFQHRTMRGLISGFVKIMRKMRAVMKIHVFTSLTLFESYGIVL